MRCVWHLYDKSFDIDVVIPAVLEGKGFRCRSHLFAEIRLPNQNHSICTDMDFLTTKITDIAKLSVNLSFGNSVQRSALRGNQLLTCSRDPSVIMLDPTSMTIKLT